MIRRLLFASFAATAIAFAPGGVAAQRPAADPPPEGRYLSLAGVRIYYEAHGTPQPGRPSVMLLHGGTAAGNTWVAQIPRLVEAGYHVIVPDFRAHGRSGDGSEALTYDRLAADIVGIMNLLQLAQAHLVGWSMGGAAALHVAVRHPERVASLTLLGAPHSSEGLTDAMRERIRTIDPWDWAPVVVEYYRAHAPDPAYWPRAFEKVRTLVLSPWRLEPRALAGVDVPALVIAGARDDVVPADHQQALVGMLPHADLLLVQEAGHFPHQERPEEVNQALIRFLDRVRPRD